MGDDKSSTRCSDEEWREAPGFPGLLFVSNTGRIRSVDRTITRLSQRGNPHQALVRGRIMRPYFHTSSGYLYASLTVDGAKMRRQIHRLVIEAFHGPPFPGQMTRHLDGNKLNNWSTNLKWGTARENAQDALKHGQLPGHSTPGESNSQARITTGDARDIRRRYADGDESYAVIAADYPISKSTVGRIVRGERWTIPEAQIEIGPGERGYKRSKP